MSDQEHHPDWRTMLPGCFGKMDRQFAIHPEDEKRAKKAIAAAKEAGVSRAEFQQEMNSYLDKNVGNQNHRAALAMKQAKKLEKMWR
jgi:hypothetical protein